MNGVICTNTTISREPVEHSPLAKETGGLSGKPLMARSTEVTRMPPSISRVRCRSLLPAGIMSAQDAVEKMEAGASIVQLYTGFIYKGPELIADCSEAIAQWRDQHGR